MDNKLQTMNIGGNLHEAAVTINQHWPEIVNSIVAMHYSPDNVIVAYRYPRPVDRRPNFLRNDLRGGVLEEHSS